MDIFTHALLPLAVVALLRRPLAQRLAAGLGAAMPDMDALFSWMVLLADPLYAFTHRGWSHSLWGAPLLGAVGLAFVGLVLARRWPRLRAFEVNQATLLAACAGGLSHIALDALTISGVPALWPLSTQRFTASLFYFSALYMLPVSAYAVWRLYKGRLDDRMLRRAALLLALALVVGGGLRAATMPRDVAPGSVVQPTISELRWIVARPLGGGGWLVQDHGYGAPPVQSIVFGNASANATAAVALARGLGAFTAWHWTNPTPIANATAIGDGWRVEFRDAVALHRNATMGFFGTLGREPRPLVVEVVDGQARVVERPAFWGLESLRR